jgi:transposase, IS605 orfB family|nr:MAG TPA: endonuclease [Caudoviricetes sp.]
MYLEYIQKEYANNRPYPNNYEYSKYLNALKNDNPDFHFIKEACSKAIQNTMDNLNKAIQRFFNKTGGYPKFKSKKRNPIRSVFLRNDGRKYLNFLEYNPKYMKLPYYGKMKIKYRKRELFLRPTNDSISSGRLVKDGNKYYICLIYEKDIVNIPKNNISCGIDLGITNYATIYYSDGNYYQQESILKDSRYMNIDSKIKHLQVIISHKQEINYQRLLTDFINRHDGDEPSEKYKNIMKGESYNTSNITKIWIKIRRLYTKRTNIVKDFINKLVNDIVVRTKPLSITVETLNIKDMLENDSSHSLHDIIAKSNWYKFFISLKNKCEEFMIELRRADKYFASSKKCSVCGEKNKNLTLNDRVYYCVNCNTLIDRDLNAAINLCKLTKYTVVI